MNEGPSSKEEEWVGGKGHMATKSWDTTKNERGKSKKKSNHKWDDYFI